MGLKAIRSVLVGGLTVAMMSTVVVVSVVHTASAASRSETTATPFDHDSEPAGPATPMTRVRLLSVVVPPLCGLPRARLVDGVHPLDTGLYGPWAAIVGYRPGGDDERPETVIGDLNGDGVADGLIILACSPGGNGYAEKALAYRSDGHLLGLIPVPRHVPPSQFAIGFDHHWTAIIGGTVRLRVYSHRPNDSSCCPSRVTVLRFRWTAAGFQLVPN